MGMTQMKGKERKGLRYWNDLDEGKGKAAYNKQGYWTQMKGKAYGWWPSPLPLRGRRDAVLLGCIECITALR